jgi:hypothetical protein
MFDVVQDAERVDKVKAGVCKGHVQQIRLDAVDILEIISVASCLINRTAKIDGNDLTCKTSHLSSMASHAATSIKGYKTFQLCQIHFLKIVIEIRLT